MNSSRKGTLEINHSGSDQYVRCLLLLDGSDLQHVLDRLAEMTDADFRRALRHQPDFPTEGDPPDDTDIGAGILPNPGALFPSTAVNHAVPDQLLTRFQVGIHGLQPVRVFFDHFTSGGKRQKGYAVCPSCNICRWRVVGDTDSKELYGARMLVWANACHRSATPKLHRVWEPPEPDVAVACRTMTLEDF